MFNKVVLVGRIVRPLNEANITTIAVDGGKNKDGERRTDFIPIIVSQAMADKIGQYLVKGKLLLIEGRIHSYTSNKVNHLIVSVSGIRFLCKKSESSESESESGMEKEKEIEPEDIFE